MSVNNELENFTYISSHDLQEPLRKIHSFAKRILDKENDNLSDEGKDLFRRISEASVRMQILIQDLLAFSRLGHTEELFENTNLNKIVEEVKVDLRHVIEEKHAIIDVGIMDEIKIIPFQFRQLVHNLLSNSLKYSNLKIAPHIIMKSHIAKGIKHINTKLSPEINYCHITISDNGIGFEKEYSDKIFEVFKRLHSREEYAGTGIGLAIVKKIVENHKGFISAESELGKGATFNIYLPA